MVFALTYGCLHRNQNLLQRSSYRLLHGHRGTHPLHLKRKNIITIHYRIEIWQQQSHHAISICYVSQVAWTLREIKKQMNWKRKEQQLHLLHLKLSCGSEYMFFKGNQKEGRKKRACWLGPIWRLRKSCKAYDPREKSSEVYCCTKYFCSNQT